IDKMVLDGDEIVTLSGVAGEAAKKPKMIAVARYDQNGKRLGGFSIAESDGHLIPSALVPAGDKEGYYIATRYENKTNKDLRFGVVYRVDKAGKRLWRRAYMPGLVTTIDDAAMLEDGDLMLAGSVRNDNGRVNGWLARIDK